MKPDNTDAYILVVLVLLSFLGLMYTWEPKDYLTVDSPIRFEVAAGEVLDMHLGELLDYTVEGEIDRRKRQIALEWMTEQAIIEEERTDD